MVGVVEKFDLREARVLREMEGAQDALRVFFGRGRGGVGFDSGGVHAGVV